MSIATTPSCSIYIMNHGWLLSWIMEQQIDKRCIQLYMANSTNAYRGVHRGSFWVFRVIQIGVFEFDFFLPNLKTVLNSNSNYKTDSNSNQAKLQYVVPMYYNQEAESNLESEPNSKNNMNLKKG